MVMPPLSTILNHLLQLGSLVNNLPQYCCQFWIWCCRDNNWGTIPITHPSCSNSSSYHALPSSSLSFGNWLPCNVYLIMIVFMLVLKYIYCPTPFVSKIRFIMLGDTSRHLCGISCSDISRYALIIDFFWYHPTVRHLNFRFIINCA